ncbi:MAG TPA: S-adenosylmethionine:tRNA ribosyltransferase-isomerase [Acidimicrobiales bacterium]|nr:S-adenosylmethionine:tRNA ribosyltransferase-isomerase [Acidimicrobiales bacterium]
MTTSLVFDLPPALEATEPPETRGLRRDRVRMMVAFRSDRELVHTTFDELPTFLEAGDLVVVNTSGTIPAAVNGKGTSDGTAVVIHLSTRLDGNLWVVEPRWPTGLSTRQWRPDDDGDPPTPVRLGHGGHLELLQPYMTSKRLWLAQLSVSQPELPWLAANGTPIRYRYLDRSWPSSAYQSVYVTELGSAEMPSAGRPFSPEVITRLVAKGVGVTPIVLHTGVASLEADELPYPERVKVPRATAHRVSTTRQTGGRVVAIGTSVVRALEAAVDPTTGEVRQLDGWTDLVITPERAMRAVDGLLTGWHEPTASHLLMLEAIGGHHLLEQSYEAALQEGYLWHEFGDSHLVLP